EPQAPSARDARGARTPTSQGGSRGEEAARNRALLDTARARQARGEDTATATVDSSRGARTMPLTPPPSSGLTPDVSRPYGGAPATLPFTLSAIEATQSRLDDDRRTSNTYAVEIEKKFALSVACIVFVLLGAPVALRFPRGGVGLVLGVSL